MHYVYGLERIKCTLPLNYTPGVNMVLASKYRSNQ